jgi:hypothetical protein
MDPATIRIDERFNPGETEPVDTFVKSLFEDNGSSHLLVLTVIALGLS